MKKILLMIGALIIVCCTALGLAACNGKPKIADNTEYYDSITKTLKLDKSYAGKNFFSDGIGEAKLVNNVDGDTSSFSLVEGGRTITIRYYSIDTPESTGGVEKWGKSASLFTKSKLDNATEIVLEASETPATTDSYGTRYLGYVWYKTAEDKDFKCLNLEIVENGYSDNKGNATNKFVYNNYFKQANDFARSIKLRIYSELDDPLYSEDPVDITLKEFYEHIDLYFNKETNSGAKVRFNAYLVDLYVATSGTYTFTAEQYDEETGEVQSINIYAGYTSASASRMKIGNYYQFVGVVQEHYGKLQISGISYDADYAREYNTHDVQSQYYLTFNSEIDYYINFNVTLYSDLTVNSVKVEGTVMTISATAQKCGKNGYGDELAFTLQVPVEAGYTPTLGEGDEFSVRAYNFDSKKFDNTKDVLKILNINDIIKR
ncbi:MAG: thermonuclease family protein [Clostridia bacterium]|nr:thermonuclease family protein [Clostridia bacterium]